jgi:membrane protease YdiL (CAAX protease family)
MTNLLQYAMGAAAIVTIPVSLLLWLLAIDRRMKTGSILPAEHRRPVPWRLLDLLLLAVLGLFTVLAAQFAGAVVLGIPLGNADLPDLEPWQRMGMLLMFSCASLLIWLMAVGICRTRAQATWRDLGLDPAKFAFDVQLGFGAFAMLVVPMMLVHLVALAIFGDDELHPFIELIAADPRLIYLLPIAFAAVIVAPLVEESLFRVLLQGWLERLAADWEARNLRAPAADWGLPVESGGSDQVEAENPSGAETQSDVMAPTESDEPARTPMQTPPQTSANRVPGEQPYDDTPTHSDSPWTSPTAESAESSAALRAVRDEAADSPGALPRARWLRWLPIVASSLLFAGAHTGQGPAPISLFLLALGLGYVYQRTHRIVPCLVVHMLVNAWAVAQLTVMVLGDP